MSRELLVSEIKRIGDSIERNLHRQFEEQIKTRESQDKLRLEIAELIAVLRPEMAKTAVMQEKEALLKKIRQQAASLRS
ncbi:MAG: hypothetical protein HQM11_07945 [SAR324 cluster bacterium]|nr:hypothetical protein [SAR324 cluster bacterium]